MKLHHTFAMASGNAYDDCHALGFRYPRRDGFEPGRGESFIVELSGEWVRTTYCAPWFTSLWRSPAGNVYAAEIDGVIAHSRAGAPDVPLEEKELDFFPTGVWGLHDELVLAWGASEDVPRVARWDGRAWSEIPSPSGRIHRMHGIAPDLIFGVGDGGLITRWDGARWHDTAVDGAHALDDVFVVSEDEVYATSWSGHRLFQGSVYGWTELHRAEQPLAAVAKWGDRVWVSALGELGLSTWDGAKLVSVDPGLQAISLDARERLLVCTLNDVADTADGQHFRKSQVEAFAEAVAGIEPSFDV